MSPGDDKPSCAATRGDRSSLCHAGADDGVPSFGDDLLGGFLLLEGRELRFGVAFCRRKRGEHVGWRFLGLDEVVKRIGWQYPLSQPTWPSSEQRCSSQSFAALGWVA